MMISSNSRQIRAAAAAARARGSRQLRFPLNFEYIQLLEHGPTERITKRLLVEGFRSFFFLNMLIFSGKLNGDVENCLEPLIKDILKDNTFSLSLK